LEEGFEIIGIVSKNVNTLGWASNGMN
jgi:hypothetical protein